MRIERRGLILGCLAVGLLGCLSTRGPTQPSGAKAPTFTATSHRSGPVSSRDLIGDGPLVVVFYRGFW